MAKNEKRVQVTLACEVCKRRNYITTKNKLNDRERIEMKIVQAAGDRRSTRCTRRPAEPGPAAAGATLGWPFPRSGGRTYLPPTQMAPHRGQ